MSRYTLVSLLFVVLSFHAIAASPNADQIFPDSTKGFFAIKNLKDFGDQWSNTQFGQLTNDSLMENFKKEVQKQLTERMESTFGLTLDGISSLPSGEVAFGMIAIPNQIPGYVLTMDVAEKRKETNEYLDNLTKKLVNLGVKKNIETYKGQQITVLTFPASEVPRTIQGTRAEITINSIERNAYYMFWQDVLLASDRPHLLYLIIDRLAGQSAAKSLAEVEAYQTVMKRCIGDMPDGTSPIIRWYVEPLDYGESVRIVLQNRNPAAPNQRTRPSAFVILKQQGFDAILGIGGVVSLTGEEQETVYRTFINTKKPYQLAMQMLDFPNNTQFTPPTWMPTDLARCTMLNVDPQVIFDNIGPLFDEFVMPGEKGVWRDIIDGLKFDAYGPKIDVREELVAHLGNHIMSMSRYEKPITIKSESIVVAVELKSGQEQAMFAGIEKLFGNDKEWMFTPHKTYKIWHRKHEDVIAPEDWDQDPDLFRNQSENAHVSPMVVLGQVNNNDKTLMFPEGGVVVAQGCLFFATDIEYLKVILDRLDAAAETSIGSATEYKKVEQIFGGMGLVDKPHFFQFFARTHETMRPTYEMIRLDRMAQSQALLGKLLNEFLSPETESLIRRQIIDGSTLPEFDKVEHYFGTVGIYGLSEEGGVFIKGFTLEREK